MKNNTSKKIDKAYLKAINVIKEDAEEEMTNAAEEENPVQLVTFQTSDSDLIDALNSGFEEVVFFVKDEEKDDVKEVKFKKDSFGNVTVAPFEEETIEDEESVEGENPAAECNETDAMNDEPEDDNVDLNNDELDDESESDDDGDSDNDGDSDDIDQNCNNLDKECCKGGKCNAFESAIRRIKQKYIIK